MSAPMMVNPYPQLAPLLDRLLQAVDTVATPETGEVDMAMALMIVSAAILADFGNREMSEHAKLIFAGLIDANHKRSQGSNATH